MQHLQVKAAATTTDRGEFSALAAAYSVDRVRDRIVPGAFEKTIKAWQDSQKQIPLHYDHGTAADQIIGVVDPASMRETKDGLYVEGKLDLEGSEVAREAWRSMKNNALALSFGYLATKTRKKGQVTELLEIDLFEVSIVPAPANNDTRVLSLKSVQEAQVEAVKDALADKAIVRDPELCSVEEPWAVMDGEEVVSCHMTQEEAREGMAERMSSIAEAAARSVQHEPEPADEKTLRRQTFDASLESASGGKPRKASPADPTPVIVDTEEKIRAVIKDELAQVVKRAEENKTSAVEDGSDEEPETVKSAPQDPLRKRTDELSLEIASGGLSRRKFIEPVPEPDLEPLDERELRRRADEVRLEIASGK